MTARDMRRPVAMPRVALLALAGLAGLVACNGGAPSYLDEAERELGVSRTWYGSDKRAYHAALLLPKGLGLSAPGYVVGVENLRPEATGFTETAAAERRRGEKHVLTHIVRYHLGKAEAGGTAASCVLFTLLDRPETEPTQRLFERCPEVGHPAPTGRRPATCRKARPSGACANRCRRP